MAEVSNYPDTTWPGDPSAPWNEQDDLWCADCRHYFPGDSDYGICGYEFGLIAQRELTPERAARCITSYDYANCAHWEEA